MLASAKVRCERAAGLSTYLLKPPQQANQSSIKQTSVNFINCMYKLSPFWLQQCSPFFPFTLVALL